MTGLARRLKERLRRVPPAEPAAPSGPTQAQRNLNDIAYVDTIDVCQLKCPTCVRGLRGLENSAKTMPLDKFGAIVAKIASEGYNTVALYNWTEPFLNPRIADYIAEVKRHGLHCWVSTNFSLRRIPALEAALRSGIDYMIVSVSGFEQKVYEINHVDGDIEYVKANLRRAAEIKHSAGLPVAIRLRFIKFDYNHDQEPRLAALARELGIEFEAISGSGDPTGDKVIHTRKFFQDCIATARSERHFDAPGKVCPLMFGQLVLNHEGKVSLCCGFPQYDVLQVGNYLDLPQEEILLRRYAHPMCNVCNFPRRDATPDDREALLDAVRFRMAV
jgi:MoaA/NifB/PqqE/SkfB family radical SAM enzyme